jgi:putative Holliday junction resolvase
MQNDPSRAPHSGAGNSKLKIIKYLGIDWGKKRIGLALGDSETKIASPFEVVGSIDEIVDVAREENIDSVVIGKPTPITNLQITNEEYNEFVNELKKRVNVSVKFVDERLSSKAADALEGDKKTKASRDATAAMLILQTYLDSM